MWAFRRKLNLTASKNTMKFLKRGVLSIPVDGSDMEVPAESYQSSVIPIWSPMLILRHLIYPDFVLATGRCSSSG